MFAFPFFVEKKNYQVVGQSTNMLLYESRRSVNASSENKDIRACVQEERIVNLFEMLLMVACCCCCCCCFGSARLDIQSNRIFGRKQSIRDYCERGNNFFLNIFFRFIQFYSFQAKIKCALKFFFHRFV